MRGWLFVVIGALLVLLGALWTLQGLDVLGGSAMSGVTLDEQDTAERDQPPGHRGAPWPPAGQQPGHHAEAGRDERDLVGEKRTGHPGGPDPLGRQRQDQQRDEGARGSQYPQQIVSPG